MDSACLGAVFFILRERQFPVRDMVDDDLILAAMEVVKDGEWYRIVQREFYPSQLLSCGSGETHEDLRRDLEQCRRMKVCVGQESVLPDEYWNWDMKPNDKIIIVVKPDQ